MKNNLLISNDTQIDLRVMLEPNADVFDINPASFAEVIADFANSPEPLQIVVHPDSCISIWIIGDVYVKLEEGNLEFPQY